MSRLIASSGSGTGVPLKMLIMEAYDARTFQVSGGSGWMQGQLPINQVLKMLQRKDGSEDGENFHGAGAGPLPR